jgi:hypothetical protein
MTDILTKPLTKDNFYRMGDSEWSDDTLVLLPLEVMEAIEGLKRDISESRKQHYDMVDNKKNKDWIADEVAGNSFNYCGHLVDKWFPVFKKG